MRALLFAALAAVFALYGCVAAGGVVALFYLGAPIEWAVRGP